MSHYIMPFGRWEDPAHTEAFFASQPHPTVRQAAPALFAQDDDADVDLCALYEKATGQRWNSLNQNPRGFCVGFGNAKMATLAIAMMAHAREIDWPGADVAVEPVYGGSRFEIGRLKYGSSLHRGDDGSVGSWAAEWLLEYGVLLKQPYGRVDLTRYSLERCALYGQTGVDDSIEDDARLHPLKEMSLCERGEDVWRLIGQLHPVVHCSSQGFAMQRQRDGTCSAVGSWAHCAGWSGRFTLRNGTPVVRYDNSWNGDVEGGGYLGGPVIVEGRNGPIALNGNQFLVPLEVVDRMCRSGRETYAMTGPRGFTQRRPLFLI
jgi:hypothetical protein